MKRCIDMRLEVTEKEKGEVALPRAVRLARKYKLSENEAKLFYYVLVDLAGLYLDLKPQQHLLYGGRALELTATCKVLDLSLLEVMEFFTSERKHMEDGIFPDINQTYILTSSIRLESEVGKALLGGKLSSSEYLKVDNTPLGDILAEEPGSEHYTKGLLEPAGECVHTHTHTHTHRYTFHSIYSHEMLFSLLTDDPTEKTAEKTKEDAIVEEVILPIP